MLQNRPGNAVLGARAFARSFPPWIISACLAVAVGIAYFLAARLSLALLTNPDGVAVFWPAAGVSAGVLIGLGPKARLPVIVGVMAATITANLLGDRNILSSIVFAACNAFEAVLVADLIERYFGTRFGLDNLRRVLGLVAAAIIGAPSPGIGGTVGYLLFHDGNIRPDNLVPLVRVRRGWDPHGCSVRDRSRRHGARSAITWRICRRHCGPIAFSRPCSVFIFLPRAPWDDIASS